jgi:adenosine deaminase
MPIKTKAKHPEHKKPFAELHAHLGASVDSAVLWSIAHEQGIKLPTRDYWEFNSSVTVTANKPLRGMNELDKIFHLTELIQSSPLALEPLVKEIIGGAYRSNNITVHELRFNPMKRNRGGERDLDYIILSSILGMERALLEYPTVKAGIVLMLDRTFTLKQNKIILEKAIKFKSRGIVGLDIAGPQDRKFKIKEHVKLFKDAKKADLKITFHTGEEGDLSEMNEVVDLIEPDRIGHGVLAWQDKALMKKLATKKIALELCPKSNLNIGIIKNIADMRKIYKTLFNTGVNLTVNTDGPEMHGTNLKGEFAFLKENKIFGDRELEQIRRNGFKYSFIPGANQMV